MKVALIEPGYPTEGLSWDPWVDDEGRFFSATLGPIHVASQCRDHDDVFIIDEKVDGPVGDVDADVVGISFKSMHARHAYALADRLRKNGSKVVMGGLHATLNPHEAGLHADAVVIGEGEATFRQVLDDLERNALKPRYRAVPSPEALRGLQVRYDLVDHDKYLVHSMQSGRGCTFGCEFCPTAPMFGSSLRLREADRVAREAEHLLSISDKPILFTENVFGGGNLEHIRALTERLAAMNARFGVICDWQMITPGIVDLLAASGCKMVLLNMTGESSEAEIRAVRLVHDAGLGIWGYFMFGFETDGPYVFENTINVVHKYDVGFVTLTVLSPYPGTPMGQRLEHEERIFDGDMSHYDQAHVVFNPARMTVDELRRGYELTCNELAPRIRVDRVMALLNG